MKKKISIILPSLASGGAERLAVSLANDWIHKEFLVDLVLLKDKKEPFKDLLDKDINIIDLKIERLRKSILPLFRYFKTNKPDVIWVGLWPLTSLSVISWLMSGRKGKIYTIDHNQLSISTVKILKIPKFILKIITRITYPFASGCMAVAEGVKRDILSLTGLDQSKIKVIYNPAARGIGKEYVATTSEKSSLWGEDPGHCLLSIGTLKEQKNFQLLIKAFADLSKEIKASLIILGEGDLRPDLENLIKDLNISHKVFLPGFVNDPSKWLLSADLFVLSSNWEGLPTVLIEALDCGLPVVSTDTPTGPSEILQGGRWGTLVEPNDAKALTNAIEQNLNKIHDRNALMSRAEEFSVESISTKYLEYFELI